MDGTTPATLDATVAALVAIIEQQSRTIEVLVAEIASGTNGSDQRADAERPRWNDLEVIAEARSKIVEWLADHPDKRPSKSEIARRLKISTAIAWACYADLEAEGVIAIERTRKAHRLSLARPRTSL
ncbi:hypothetical protein [Streptomyces sp. NBC_01396]|uniref:hypothetical protein n=1 Tax=Streptomyces sp. NBC_01396 TaxID=2903852 RepID=UPI0032533B51